MARDESYAKYIDHTILKPGAGRADVKRFCDEAKEYGFMSVCVNPCWVRFVSEQLSDSDVKTCAVVGFPLGASTTRTKAEEAGEAVRNGAEEIDMVINLGALKDGDDEYVYRDILGVVLVCRPRAAVKVIIECSALTDGEKVRACKLAAQAGADFVKTSTGYGTGGATEEDVALMKAAVGGRCKVKASTGIGSRDICDRMLRAGAERMGTSKGILIVRGE